MAFSGTPITATENQGQYTCHLSEAQFVGEPNIDRAIGDTATAFYASNSLLIGGGNGFGFYFYGLQENDWTVKETVDADNQTLVATGNSIFNNVFYQVNFGFTGTQFQLVANVRAIDLGSFSDNAISVIPEPALTAFPKDVTALPANLFNSNQMGQMLNPLNNTSCYSLAGCRLTANNLQYYWLWEISDDASAVNIYNGFYWPLNQAIDTQFSGATDGNYNYFFNVIFDSDTNSYIPAIVKVKPETFVIDGGGLFDFETLLLSIDIPALQNIFDNYSVVFQLENFWIVGTSYGWLISFLDGTEYKLIVVDFDWQNYRYVNLTFADNFSSNMYDDWQNQIFPVVSSSLISPFNISGDNLYFTSADPTIAAVSFGPFILQNGSKTGNPIRVALPCHNPCIPFIVEK